MIYRFLVGFLCLLSLNARAQALRDLNYNYIYPNSVLTFDWKVVKEENGYVVYYEAHQNDASQNTPLTIKLETRTSLNEKNGNPIDAPPATGQPGSLIGSAHFQAGPELN